jgi:hypothetical protein
MSAEQQDVQAQLEDLQEEINMIVREFRQSAFTSGVISNP